MRPNNISKGLILIFSLTLLVQQSSISKESRWIKKIAQGIYYTHIKTLTARGPLHIHILKVDTTLPGIKVKPAIAEDRIGGVERVDTIAKREGAIAAINGSFFESRRFPHLPIGMLIIDGKIINKTILNRAAMGITGNGFPIFGIPKIRGGVINPKTKENFNIWGINRPRKNNEVIFYTPEYGPTTRTNKYGAELIVSGGRVVGISQGNSPIPSDGCVLSFHGWTRKYVDILPIGSDVIVNFGFAGIWEMVDQAISGGPMLIQDGQIVADSSIASEEFDGMILRPTSRTAVGVNKSGALLLFVVDRKNGISVGATYDELAGIMKNEGVIEGMGLDGGGSSTMYVDGEIKNFTMYRSPYPVANALVVEKEGYRYVAKKTKPAVKVVELPPWMITGEATWEAEWPAEYAITLMMPKDMLIDLYEKLVLPMITTGEVIPSNR